MAKTSINTRHKPYRDLVRRGGAALVPLLDGLVATTEHSPDWQRWQYDKGDRIRFFTPLFRVPEIDLDELQLSRLHIATPGGYSRQPIIHIERTNPSTRPRGLYEGQEILWDAGSELAPRPGMPGVEGRNLEPGNPYYENFVKTIVAAHAEFCPLPTRASIR